ncbi:PqqD family peptide modification chaperone [Rhodopseudomonas sp. RCAM05734]|uniref:PqqD family peptide modification chaperone n=1 Tax=Rhodopseudomonas sp. RCAM05734 TaxID=3457549 RepID=UPI0040447D0B
MDSIAPQGSKPTFGGLRPATGTSFALIGQLPVLFSEYAQELFELTDVAAFIWCSMQDEVSLETIRDRLIDRGLSATGARQTLRDALNQWLRAGLLVPHIDAADFAFTALIGLRPLEVRASDAGVLDLLKSLFVSTAAPASKAEATFTVHRFGDSSILMHDGRMILHCSLKELAPSFRAYAVKHLLLTAGARDVIFHAAAVTSGDRGMLISAPPGVGKSTITMHLLHAGLRFATDDIVFIAPDGSIRGAPFAPTLKSGAWPLIGDFRPDLFSVPSHDRFDGKAVRYLDVGSNLHKGAMRASWFIFLERTTRCAPPVLEELSALETLKRIVGASYASHGKLTSDGFGMLKNMVSRTRSFVLHYTEAEEAVDKLLELCDGRL